MRHLPRLTAFLFSAIPLVTSTAGGQEPPCDSCRVAIDLCGAGQPFYNDPAFTANFTVADRLVAGTARGLSSNDPVVRVFDLGPAVSRIIASNNNWLAPPYGGPVGNEWSQQNLGSVFGITFDTSGNIYVAHSAAYSVFGVPNIMADFVGPGGAGAVYKIANGTGRTRSGTGRRPPLRA